VKLCAHCRLIDEVESSRFERIKDTIFIKGEKSDQLYEEVRACESAKNVLLCSNSALVMHFWGKYSVK
jgi:hypothetical protein